ncbi:MAG: hypothetical protein ABIR70_06520 [Bryobacteraceae bacterium]
MQSLIKLAILSFALCASLYAGPSEFGQQELRAALAERGITLSVTTELNLDQPETFHIASITSTSARISGGDLRGLMYGLIEAAEQIRTMGKLEAVNGEPGLRLRAVRIVPLDTDLATVGFYSLDRWTKFFQMLARNRINRATLVLPPEKWEGDRIRVLSTLAHDYGVDFAIGVRATLGARTLGAQIRKMLSECVLVRGLQIEVGREPVDFYRTTVFPAVQESGRRVTLDLRGVDARPDVLRAAQAAGIVMDIASRTTAAAQGNPFHAIAAPESEIDPVRARLNVLASNGATGFEVDLAGVNIDNYERVYWTWGRQGYLYRTPGMTAGKSQTKSKK